MTAADSRQIFSESIAQKMVIDGIATKAIPMKLRSDLAHVVKATRMSCAIGAFDNAGLTE